MKITDVYQFYQDNVKPIYSEIEARDNNIPVELLFETYATFDHIKRYYLNGESEETASQKAISHLKRGVLDAFKLKLKYLNKDIEILLNTKVDLQLIDNGQFISSLYKDRQEIITLAKKARLTEGKQSKEEAFQILEVMETSTRQEIKNSRNRLINQWHPDKHRTPLYRETAEKNTKLIISAYELLRELGYAD